MVRGLHRPDHSDELEVTTMYVLTITNDASTHYDTKVFAEDVNLRQVIDLVTNEFIHGVSYLCRRREKVTVGDFIAQTLESAYPEYEHQLTDARISDQYLEFMDAVQSASDDITGAVEALEMDAERGFLKVLAIDDDTFTNKYIFNNMYLFRYLLGWSVSTDGRVEYEVYFERTATKNDLAGPRVRMKLEYKESYDSVEVESEGSWIL